MPEVVIVEAVRSPFGKRGGGLSTTHSVDLLAIGAAGRSSTAPASTRPRSVRSSAGASARSACRRCNVTRTAWLTGRPARSSVAATTVDTQCGSSQQATNIAYALVAGGVVDVAVGVRRRGDEPGADGLDRPQGPVRRQAGQRASTGSTTRYTSQFEGAERIAEQWGITRGRLRRASASSRRTGRPRRGREGRFDSQIVPIEAPVLDADGKPTGDTTPSSRDEGVRETTLEALAGLKPHRATPTALHTAGTASQISDGASARAADDRRAGRRRSASRRVATIVDTCLVGQRPGADADRADPAPPSSCWPQRADR